MLMVWCISSDFTVDSFLVNRLGADIPALEKHYGIASTEYTNGLPQNDAITELPNALAAAHKHYSVKEYVRWQCLYDMCDDNTCR